MLPVTEEHAKAWTLNAEGEGRIFHNFLRDIIDEPEQTNHKPSAEELMRLTGLSSDIKYSARMLRVNYRVLAPAVLALALGIGGATALFNVVNTVLFNAVPFSKPGQLVTIKERNLSLGVPEMSVSPANWKDFSDRSRSFSEVSAIRHVELNLFSASEPERLKGAYASGGFFKMLGAGAALGTLPGPQYDDPDHKKVVVLSHELWTRSFGSDPTIVGKDIQLGDGAYKVIGVLESDFRFPLLKVDFWAPFGMDAATLAQRQSRYITLIGRIKDGVSVADAQHDLDGVSAQLAGEYPAEDKGWTAIVQRLDDSIIGEKRPALITLLAGGGLLLLVACGNVAIVLLSRAEARDGEVAIRSALGASSARILGQLLIESLVLSAIAGTVGGWLAWIAGRWLSGLKAASIPGLDAVHFDFRVLSFAAGLSVVCSILAGLVPGFRQAFRNNSSVISGLHNSTRGGGRRLTGQFLLNGLVAAQIAFSFVLLAGAGLLVRSFDKLIRVNPGFDYQNVATLKVDLPAKTDKPRIVQFYGEVLNRLRALPEVQAAGGTLSLPIADGRTLMKFTIPGVTATGKEVSAGEVVTPGYFETMKISVIAGRTFTEADEGGSNQPIIVSKSFARIFFGNQNPIGKFITPDGGSGQMEIVGIVSDVRDESLESEGSAAIYSLFDRTPYSSMTMCVRTTGDPASAIESLKSAIHQVDAKVPVESADTMQRIIDDSQADRRLTATAMTAFAVVTLILSAVGVYGSTAYRISRSFRDIAIRRALGATTGDITRFAGTTGLMVIAAGLAAGCLAALGASRALSSQLFGITKSDPATYIVTGIVLALSALVPVVVNTRRAVKADPVALLRLE